MCPCGGELTVWCFEHGDWVCDDCGCPAHPDAADLDRYFECPLCGDPVEDPDDVFCGDCIEAINTTDVIILDGRRVDTLQPDARFL